MIQTLLYIVMGSIDEQLQHESLSHSGHYGNPPTNECFRQLIHSWGLGGINVLHDGRLPPTYPPYTTKDPLTSMS